MGKNVNYGLAVSLKEEEAALIATNIPGPVGVSEKLGVAANSLLRDLARGGTMIPPEYANRIQDAIGSTDPVAIVAAVEKSAGRVGEATSVEWIVDPTQIAFYRGLADNAGVSLQMQLKSLMDYAYSQGWFGMGAPDVFKLLLTPAQYRDLQVMFARDIVTGADVFERLGVEMGVLENEDPIMESLMAEGV